MPVADRGPASALQGYELVAHVFVAADGTSADRRFVEDLWHRCVVEFALDEAVAPYDGGDAPADRAAPGRSPAEAGHRHRRRPGGERPAARASGTG